MRILYFSRDYTPHDHRFLSALAESEHEVHFLRLEQRGLQLEDRPIPPGVRQVSWAGGRKPARLIDGARLLLSLRKVIREVKPDLIHAGPIQTAGLLAALSGFRPLVSMSWAYDLLFDADKNRLYRWATKTTLKRTDVLVADCETVAQLAVGHSFPRERIVTFPWGLDLAQFSPGTDDGLRERRGWQENFILLHTRSWEPLYGVDVFIKAFIQAARQRPELRLFLLGNGSQAGTLRQMLMQAGMLDRVHFGGQVRQADLPRYYRAADLYVSASHSDGSSLSLMEALACGTPALVSDIPGNREWIEPGVAGWLFKDGDADALAQGILQAVNQGKNLKTTGQNARKLAEERADWPKNVEKLLEGYEMAIKKRKGEENGS
jgi:glycosyltransferase involved in cell wall biosynthesis